MNLSQFISTVKQVCLLHKGVAQFNSGDVYETMNSGTQHYPAIVLTISNLTGTEDAQSYNCSMFYIDRLTDDESNKTDVQSESITVLKDIQAKLKENLAIEIEANSYTPFTEKFADLCAGSYLDCIMTIPENVICSDSNFDSRELEVKTNGTYSTIGYDKVKVATRTKADPVLESITIESNGHYEPAEGVDGYNNIEVNVPIPEPKLETLNVTNNGTYDAPKEIDGYNKVVVEVPSEVNDPFGFDTIGYTPESMPYIKEQVQASAMLAANWDPNTGYASVEWYQNKDSIYFPLIDMSNVQTAELAFAKSNFEVYPGLNLSNCTNMRGAFRESNVLRVPNLHIKNDKNTDITNIFSQCRKLEYVESQDWSEITDFKSLFDDCSSMQYIGNIDMSKGTSFEYTFKNCSSFPRNYLTTSPVRGWQVIFNVPNATNMKSTFREIQTTNLYYIEVNAADYSNFDSCFLGLGVEKISLGSTKPEVLEHICDNNSTVVTFCEDGLDCSNVRVADSMFNWCYGLQNIGVLHNLGQAFNGGPYMGYDNWYKVNIGYEVNNLTDQSIQNLIDSLYNVTDYNLNAIYGVDATFMVNSQIFSRLSDEQKSSITSKGWVLAEGDE